MKLPYFCCIGAELKRYTKDFDFMNQVYLYKVPTDDSIDEVLAEDYFKMISDSVLQDDIVYIYEASAETLHSCRFNKQNGHITAVPLASDETLTGAVTSIIHDNLTKNRAVISNNDGKIAVSDVTSTELDYLSGATSNIQTQLNNKASKDLDNLTAKGANITNWSSNVSDCIIEIPQYINLELDAGTLTLKAGSKCYLKTDTTTPSVTIESDLTTTQTTDGKYLAFYDGSALTTALISAYDYSTLPSTYSFPLALLTVSSGAIKRIDRVFNGFGFFGTSTFIFPGVKALVPAGFNEDGTLKSELATRTTIGVLTFSDTNARTVGIKKGVGSGMGGFFGRPYFQENYPGNNYKYWYRPSTNRVYNSGTGQGAETAADLTWLFYFDPVTGDCTFNDVFHALDFNPEAITTMSMPSKRYVDLTLGTSGSYYTAKADGYYIISKQSVNADEYVTLLNTTTGFGVDEFCPANMNARLFIPVSKGDTIQINYTLTGTTGFFRFVYANGAQ